MAEGQERLHKLRAKVKHFPTTPGVYLMKDDRGRVLYIGKAASLKHRVSTYFSEAAIHDPRTADLIPHIHDVDFLECDSEVDALLTEARLIKDLQPPFNDRLKDDKSFPYLQIRIREDFPRVEFTREPLSSGVKLYGPFASAKALRGAIQVLQKIFRFRTCSLDIREGDPKWQWFRPCLLYFIHQCSAPCNLKISKDEYRKDIERLRLFLEGKKADLIEQLEREMKEAAVELRFEDAARIRDELAALRNLHLRGDLEQHVQPEVFYIDPQKGLHGLQKVLKLAEPPRVIEGIDVAHLAGNEIVGSLVQFIDGTPFKPGYRKYRIRTVQGVDDYRAIAEVAARRFRRLRDEESPFPNLFLVDGGRGQLHAALEAIRSVGVEPPMVVALAKEEEVLYVPNQAEPLRLSRHSFALRLLQYVRDEAHRFAQHYHHLLRRKRLMEQPGRQRSSPRRASPRRQHQGPDSVPPTPQTSA
jgi:excinuclease ABC subunit C